MFDNAWSFFIMAVIILVSCFIYFVPYLVASYRRSRNVLLVFVINLFFGWSLIGWIVALILAFMGDTQPVSQCPYCLSYINAKARKCAFCGEWLDGSHGSCQPKNPALVPPPTVAEATVSPVVTSPTDTDQNKA